MLGLDAIERHAVSADRASNEKRTRLDAIGDHFVLGAVQLAHAFDDDAPRTRAFDFRAHLVEEICEIDHFGFGSRAFDHGHALGQDRRHHHVVGAENGRAKFSAQSNDRAGKFWREHFDISIFDAHRGTERFKTF